MFKSFDIANHAELFSAFEKFNIGRKQDLATSK